MRKPFCWCPRKLGTNRDDIGLARPSQWRIPPMTPPYIYPSSISKNARCGSFVQVENIRWQVEVGDVVVKTPSLPNRIPNPNDTPRMQFKAPRRQRSRSPENSLIVTASTLCFDCMWCFGARTRGKGCWNSAITDKGTPPSYLSVRWAIDFKLAGGWA